MQNDQLIEIINLLNILSIGPQKVRNIVEKYPGAIDYRKVTETELCQVEGIDLISAQAIKSNRNIDIGRKIVRNAVDKNIGLISLWDDKNSVGCNRLIRNGAFPIEDGGQLMEENHPKLFYPTTAKQITISLDLSADEHQFVKCLSNNPIHIDSLTIKSGFDLTKLLNILLTLELKGAVVQIGGKQFVLA